MQQRRAKPLLALFALAVLLAVLLAAAALYGYRRPPDRDTLMAGRLQARVASASAAQVGCGPWRAQRPLVLLVLGQSNAGNHGLADAQGAGQPLPAPVQVMEAGRCSLSHDPLPGATGAGTSPWSVLPARLAAAGLRRPVLLQVLAVDASTVDDWTRAGAPITRQLAQTLAANRAAGLPPDLVLWQQGEADAQAGTPPTRYVQGLQALADSLRAQGVRAPLLLALSTVCRSAPADGLRRAIADLAASDPRFRRGPDTDAITQRHDGCHWSDSGRHQVAGLWASAIVQTLPASALALPP